MKILQDLINDFEKFKLEYNSKWPNTTSYEDWKYVYYIALINVRRGEIGMGEAEGTECG